MPRSKAPDCVKAYAENSNRDMDVETLKTASGYLIATFFTTIGIGTMIDPITRSDYFGVTTRPEDRGMLAILGAMAARDLALGINTGLFMFKGDRKNAGRILLVAVMIPAIDAWAAWTYNGRMEEVWPHVIGVGIVGALGLWLRA